MGPVPTTNVAGLDVYCESEGSSGPSLLFIHGFRNSSQSWMPLRSRLDASRTRAWYLDLPGCGRSDVPATWKDCTIAAYTETVRQFCAMVGLSDLILVGHSLGGGIAMNVALAHQGLLRGLVLVAPTPADGIGYLSEDQISSLIDPSDDELEALARAAFHRPPPEAEFQGLLATVRSASPEHIEGAIRSQRDFDIADRLGEIAVPTLVVGGDRDRHIPIRHTLRTAAAIRRCGVQIYHEVGHAPFFEVPDECASLLERFVLAEIGPDPADSGPS